MENYAIEILFAGLTIAASAWIWLLIRAFSHSIWWGICSFFVPPVAFIFSLRQPQKALALWSCLCPVGWQLLAYIVFLDITSRPRTKSKATRRIQALDAYRSGSPKRRCSRMDGFEGVLHAAWRAYCGPGCLVLAVGMCIPTGSAMGCSELGPASGRTTLCYAPVQGREFHRCF